MSGGCVRCGNRAGHTELGDASCAYRITSTKQIRLHAQEVGATPVDAADLLAHLRSIFSAEDAYRAAWTVLDLGWRKTIGATK